MADNQLGKNKEKLERLKEVMSLAGFKDAIQLAKAIKYSQGYISEILNEIKKVPKTMGQKLEDSINVNRKWFDTGVGNPFLSGSNKTNVKDFSDDNFVNLPFISIKARASFSYDTFTDNQYLEETYQVYEPVQESGYKNKKYVVIEIDGDSMEPKLPSGTVVKAFEVDKSDWPYTTGTIGINYLKHFEVKRIKENTLMKNQLLTLHSDNPAGGSKDVRYEDIVAIWKVIKIVDGPSLRVD